MKKIICLTAMCAVLVMSGCGESSTPEKKFDGPKDEVTLLTLDPGHFHAALAQMYMYDQVSPEVYVYAPEGDDVKMHLDRIKINNEREQNPTQWNENLYTGEDFLEKMLQEKKGNVVGLAGNNGKKTAYVKAAVNAGINVLSDKPMAIDAERFLMLE